MTVPRVLFSPARDDLPARSNVLCDIIVGEEAYLFHVVFCCRCRYRLREHRNVHKQSECFL